MFKGFQERILGQLFRILLILHDAYNQDKYLLTVFIQKVLVERSFPFYLLDAGLGERLQ